MRGFIKHLYHDTTVGYWLISPLKIIYDISIRIFNIFQKYYQYRIISDRIFLKKIFKGKLGYSLNLEDPKTLNEKIQWLKLNERKPLHTLCADKFAVREYIKEKIGEEYLIPLVYHTDNPENIDSGKLPDFPFVIKANHSNGGVTIVKDKSKINWDRVREKLRESLGNNFYYQTKEWQYKDIKPCILVEKLLLDNNQNVPFDYKFHCFNGQVVFIQVDLDRHINHKRNLYDPDWNFIDCRWVYDNGSHLDPPYMLAQMRSLAEILAKEFRYIRVDFYCLEREVFFGELTFHPQSGLGVFSPPEWDKIFGDRLIL